MVNKNYLRSILSLVCTSSLLIFSVVGSKGSPGELGFSFLNHARADMERGAMQQLQHSINLKTIPIFSAGKSLYDAANQPDNRRHQRH